MRFHAGGVNLRRHNVRIGQNPCSPQRAMEPTSPCSPSLDSILAMLVDSSPDTATRRGRRHRGNARFRLADRPTTARPSERPREASPCNRQIFSSETTAASEPEAEDDPVLPPGPRPLLAWIEEVKACDKAGGAPPARILQPRVAVSKKLPPVISVPGLRRGMQDSRSNSVLGVAGRQLAGGYG